MDKIILTVLFVFILCNQVFSQEIHPPKMLELYDEQAIYIHHDIFGRWYVKNAQIFPLGRFGANLKKELIGSKYAMEEMEKAQKNAKTGFIISFFASSIALTGTILEIADLDYPHKRETYISMIIISAVLGEISYGYRQSALSSMNRAVWIYNRDLVFGRLTPFSHRNSY